MSKTQKYQEFKTIDAVLMAVLLGISSLIIFAIVSADGYDPTKSRALLDAKNLALQLASGGLGNLQSTNEISVRAPAAVDQSRDHRLSIKLFGHQGRISRDPWGSPYRYKIEEKEGGHLMVFVWSDGPNKQRDTDPEKVTVFNEDQKYFLVLQGDDLGVVHESSVSEESL